MIVFPSGVQHRLGALDSSSQSAPALGAQIVTGAFQPMLQFAKVLLIHRQRIAQDRRWILHGIALRQPRPGR